MNVCDMFFIKFLYKQGPCNKKCALAYPIAAATLLNPSTTVVVTKLVSLLSEIFHCQSSATQLLMTKPVSGNSNMGQRQEALPTLQPPHLEWNLHQTSQSLINCWWVLHSHCITREWCVMYKTLNTGPSHGPD